MKVIIATCKPSNRDQNQLTKNDLLGMVDNFRTIKKVPILSDFGTDVLGYVKSIQFVDDVLIADIDWGATVDAEFYKSGYMVCGYRVGDTPYDSQLFAVSPVFAPMDENIPTIGDCMNMLNFHGGGMSMVIGHQHTKTLNANEHIVSGKNAKLSYKNSKGIWVGIEDML